MTTIFEFEITYRTTNAVAYKTVETETLEEAFTSLEQTDAFILVHRVLTVEEYKEAVEKAKEMQKILTALQKKNDDHLLSSLIEAMQNGFAVQITPKELQVFPTLDYTFERKEQ